MKESKRQLRVFLCHASADKPKVRELYRYLKKRGIQPWLDAEDLIPGQNWEVEIPKALETSDAIIICLSKRSVDKEGYVQKEIKFALDKALEMPEGRIFLIPARLEECELPHGLKKYHCVDLYEEASYSRLMRALKVRAAQLQNIAFEFAREDERYGAKAPELEGKALPVAAIQKTNQSKERLSPRSGPAVITGLIFLCVSGICASIFLPRLFRNRSATPSETPTKDLFLSTSALMQASETSWVTQVSPDVILATDQPQPTQKPTESIAPTITPLPLEIQDPVGVKMVLIPEGEFKMGSEIADSVRACKEIEKFVPAKCAERFFSDEVPPHSVRLDNFYIDKYEVTNRDFSQFLNTVRSELKIELDANSLETYGFVNYKDNYIFDFYSGWQSERDRIHWTGSEFEVVGGYEEHPVTFVSWYGASAYCQWRGARLPTEAEWEKAARGIYSSSFPWGEDINCTRANYAYGVQPTESNASTAAACVDGTTAVGSYENGKSSYGVYDMAGNVWEWVSDWYSEKYYSESPFENPLGPSAGEMKVNRGGSFVPYANAFVLSSFRSGIAPTRLDFDIGVRCARDAP